LLEGREISISLYADIDMILAIYGEEGPFSPWRILDIGSTYSLPNRDLKSPSSDEVIAIPAARAYKLNQDNLIVQIDSEPWSNPKWNYAAVESFIMATAYELEMKKTGIAKKLINDFRNMCDSAPLLPVDTKLQIMRPTVEGDEWRIRKVDELATKLGLAMKGQPAPEVFMISFADVLAVNGVYTLSYFDKRDILWKMPYETKESEVETETEKFDLVDLMNLAA
jgi:hypothetical protein